MKEAKALAFTIILMMMVVNFVVPKPVVPTLPHKSWDWLTPWPVQVVGSDLSEADKIFFAALAAALATWLGYGLMGLNDALLDAINDVLNADRDGPNGPGDGGGGGGGTAGEHAQ